MLRLSGFVLAFKNPDGDSLKPVVDKFNWSTPTVANPKATKTVGHFTCEIAKKDDLVLITARSSEEESYVAVDAMIGNLMAELHNCGLVPAHGDEVSDDGEDDEP